MKKMKAVVATMLVGLGFVSTSFASESFEVQYKYYHAYTKNACPESIVRIIDNADHLKLTHDLESATVARLLGSATEGVTVTDAIKLNKEDHNGMYAYISNQPTALQVAGELFKVKQLWIESASNKAPWESAFYLNDYCLVMTSPEAETNFLSQPRG